MEIVLNELSLDGQFASIPSFFDSLLSMIKVQKIIESADATLLRHHDLYARPVTQQHTLHQIITDNSIKTTPNVRVFKRLLIDLMKDRPFWTEDQRHDTNDRYTCDFDIAPFGHSLAEACERDKVILSF